MAAAGEGVDAVASVGRRRWRAGRAGAGVPPGGPDYRGRKAATSAPMVTGHHTGSGRTEAMGSTLPGVDLGSPLAGADGPPRSTWGSPRAGSMRIGTPTK